MNENDYTWKKEPNWDKVDWKQFHYCDLPQMNHLYGAAIQMCAEDLDGCLFVENGAYGSQVNFCPVCGYEAKVKIKEIE